jgi:hypothetical protein
MHRRWNAAVRHRFWRMGSHCSVADPGSLAVVGLGRRAEDQVTGAAGKAMVSREKRSIVRVVGRKKEGKKEGSKQSRSARSLTTCTHTWQFTTKRRY